MLSENCIDWFLRNICYVTDMTLLCFLSIHKLLLFLTPYVYICIWDPVPVFCTLSFMFLFSYPDFIELSYWVSFFLVSINQHVPGMFLISSSRQKPVKNVNFNLRSGWNRISLFLWLFCPVWCVISWCRVSSRFLLHTRIVRLINQNKLLGTSIREYYEYLPPPQKTKIIEMFKYGRELTVFAFFHLFSLF